MFGLGIGEILIILAFALIFIGPKKLPEMAKSLGKGLREFQRAKDEILHNMETDHHMARHQPNQDLSSEDDIEAEVTGVSEEDPAMDDDYHQELSHDHDDEEHISTFAENNDAESETATEESDEPKTKKA
jgi:TatA/E family protein of Tat protein translocase